MCIRDRNCVEHLLLAAFIQQVFDADAVALSKMAFVMDGPLAIFGQPAKLHARIMEFLYKVNYRLAELKLEPLLVMGLQKTGEVMDHANLISRFLPPGAFRVLDDNYRNEYIKGSEAPAANFGNETYYGQDFLFKTERGRMFNFAIPYMTRSKEAGEGSGERFAEQKIKIESYGSLVAVSYTHLDVYKRQG